MKADSHSVQPLHHTLNDEWERQKKVNESTEHLPVLDTLPGCAVKLGTCLSVFMSKIFYAYDLFLIREMFQ